MFYYAAATIATIWCFLSVRLAVCPARRHLKNGTRERRDCKAADYLVERVVLAVRLGQRTFPPLCPRADTLVGDMTLNSDLSNIPFVLF